MSVANALVVFIPTVPFRIMLPNLADNCMMLGKDKVLALALPAPAKVFTVNVDPREREAVPTDKVDLAQALQPMLRELEEMSQG